MKKNQFDCLNVDVDGLMLNLD